MNTRSHENGAQRWIFRRARSPIDGPFPVFALVGQRRIPLSPEQTAWLDDEASSLAQLKGLGIRGEIARMLDCDRTGAAADLHVAGFMRISTPYPGTLTPTPLIEPPERCDQCSRDLHDTGFLFDVCTTFQMKWCWMCPPCFFRVGCGVGEGWGQLYLQDGEQIDLVLGGLGTPSGPQPAR